MLGFVTQEILVKFMVDSSRTGEMHVQATERAAKTPHCVEAPHAPYLRPMPHLGQRTSHPSENPIEALVVFWADVKNSTINFDADVKKKTARHQWGDLATLV